MVQIIHMRIRICTVIQSNPVNSYSNNSDLRLIRSMYETPFRDDHSIIIRSIRISHFWSYFIRSLADVVYEDLYPSLREIEILHDQHLAR